MPSLYFVSIFQDGKNSRFCRHFYKKEVRFEAMKSPQNKAPPVSAKYVSPEERAWLDNMIRELVYDERMQAKRERWLGERPHKRAL